MPRIHHIFETVLYAHNVAACAAFYQSLFELHGSLMTDNLGAALRLPDHNMLLIFNPAETGKPGRVVPSSGAIGPGHIAFKISPHDYEPWKQRLTAHRTAIEHEHVWQNGARSIYFRDPAGNSVELVDGDLWG